MANVGAWDRSGRSRREVERSAVDARTEMSEL
jgi:hypothetical protein